MRGRFAGSSGDECQKLLDATLSHSGNLLQGLRSVLGVPPAAAVSLRKFLGQALTEGGTWTELLIHTTYFNHNFILERIAGVISDRDGTAPALDLAGRVDTVPVTGGDSAEAWPPRGFGSWVLRGGVRLALLLSLPLLLFLAGWSVLYFYSRESQLTWAGSPEVGIVPVMHDLSLGLD